MLIPVLNAAQSVARQIGLCRGGAQGVKYATVQIHTVVARIPLRRERDKPGATLLAAAPVHSVP